MKLPEKLRTEKTGGTWFPSWSFSNILRQMTLMAFKPSPWGTAQYLGEKMVRVLRPPVSF